MQEPIDSEPKEEPTRRTFIKNRYLIVIFLLGLLVTSFGALFKIQSWEGGALLITVGTAVMGLAILLAIFKFFNIKDRQSFF